MVNKQEVLIRHYRQGHSHRRISRDLGISRPTVARYLSQYEGFKESGVYGSEQESLGAFLQQSPRYDLGVREKRTLCSAMTRQLDAYLSANAEKRASGLYKQMMKKVDMHEGLLSLGYQIGYTTVCNYIRGQVSHIREAFIRQHYEAGISCEFDWAEAKLEIGGKSYRLMLALFSPCYSNYRWAKLYWRQDSSSFQSAHVHFFRSVGGVYQELIYDNMRVAVRKFVGAHEREPTVGLVELSGYYQFGYRFCNVGKGNEKGHVERAVEYIRRRAFCQESQFESLAAAQAHLDKICAGLNTLASKGRDASPDELLGHEKPRLYALGGDFSVGEWLSLRVNKYSCFCCGQNHYSVPDHLVGKMVDVRLSATELRVYYEGNKLCLHQRGGGQHGWCIELEHFLPTLKRKPGALSSSLALRSAPASVKDIFEAHFKDRPKVFVELLSYQRELNLDWETLESAIDCCLESCPHQAPELDKIKHFIQGEKIPEESLLPVSALNIDEEQQAILAASEAQLEAVNRLFSPSF